jgi:cell division protein FtsB
MAGPSKQGPSSRRPTGRGVGGRARESARPAPRPAASTRTTGAAAGPKVAPGGSGSGTGSAAVAAANRSTRRGQRRWTGRAAVLVIILAALTVSYASSLRAWVDQQQQMSALRTEQADQTQRVGELQDEIARWNDPAYVKAQARERFGYVMPGEVGYVVLDDKSVVKADTTAAKAKAAAVSPWWQQLWGSVDAADTAVPTLGPSGTAATPRPSSTPAPEKTIGATATPTRHR